MTDDQWVRKLDSLSCPPRPAALYDAGWLERGRWIVRHGMVADCLSMVDTMYAVRPALREKRRITASRGTC